MDAPTHPEAEGPPGPGPMRSRRRRRGRGRNWRGGWRGGHTDYVSSPKSALKYCYYDNSLSLCRSTVNSLHAGGHVCGPSYSGSKFARTLLR